MHCQVMQGFPDLSVLLGLEQEKVNPTIATTAMSLYKCFIILYLHFLLVPSNIPLLVRSLGQHSDDTI